MALCQCSWGLAQAPVGAILSLVSLVLGVQTSQNTSSCAVNCIALLSSPERCWVGTPLQVSALPATVPPPCTLPEQHRAAAPLGRSFQPLDTVAHWQTLQPAGQTARLTPSANLAHLTPYSGYCCVSDNANFTCMAALANSKQYASLDLKSAGTDAIFSALHALI